ncbi:MAG: ferritin-like domain-containing protein [Myxococcota bacterium]
MKPLNKKAVIDVLNGIVEFELAGVVRFTHYSLMVIGPNRIPIVEFLRSQATEALTHAQQAGELLTGLGGHPSMKITKLDETNEHEIHAILAESLAHEQTAIGKYQRLLELAKDRSIYLEEYARGMISAEEQHALVIHKMLRDYGVDSTKRARP